MNRNPNSDPLGTMAFAMTIASLLSRGKRRLMPLTAAQQARADKAREIAAHNEAVEARRREKKGAKAMRRAAR